VNPEQNQMVTTKDTKGTKGSENESLDARLQLGDDGVGQETILDAGPLWLDGFDRHRV
jgi:hypothetical protein